MSSKLKLLVAAGCVLLLAVLAVAITTHQTLDNGDDVTTASIDRQDILRGYRRLAHYSYEAAYHSAGQLKRDVFALLDAPSAQAQLDAQAAWRAARQDYSQTEVLRFGNWNVDDWEGSVNAWPVDEGLLDYVQADYAASPTNPLARHNLVSQPEIQVGSVRIRADALDWAQLSLIHGGSDVEANVALGYHAIEFLLWGQDLSGPTTGAGQRPWTDYSVAPGRCTSGPFAAPVTHCQRRRQLLRTMVEHLYTQLGSMTLQWAGNSPASYGLNLIHGDPNEGLRRMLFGMIRLAGDEMAGERLQVALLAGAQEDEQDCFSDDTHQSAWFNAVGISNMYYGRYRSTRFRGGFVYEAPVSLAGLAQQVAPELAARIDAAFLETRASMRALRDAGASGQTLDLLILPGNTLGRELIQRSIAALQKQAVLLEQLGAALDLGSLNPQAPQP